ncbi:MAG: hypothetical protein ACOYKJ_00025 [Candidatus Howiella sp.]
MKRRIYVRDLIHPINLTVAGAAIQAGRQIENRNPISIAVAFLAKKSEQSELRSDLVVGYEKDIIADFVYGFEFLLLLVALCSIYGCD